MKDKNEVYELTEGIVMLKKLSWIIILLIILTKLTLAQKVISCKIIDVNSMESLPYANVFMPKYSTGTCTDDEGIFCLLIDGKEKHDSVIISYIGYDSRFIEFGQLLKQKSIALSPILKQLEVVDVVYEKRKLNAKKIAMGVIELYNKNRPQYSHLSKCQAAQYIKIDGNYCFYMEALGYAIYSGDSVSKNPLVNYKFFAENTCLADRNENKLLTEMKKTGNDIGLQSNLGNGLRSFQILNFNGVLNPKQARKYTFRIDSIYSKNEEYYYSISFKKGNKEGRFSFHRESMHLISLEQESDKIWSVVKYKNTYGKEYYTFNYFDERPFFSVIKCRTGDSKLEEQSIIVNKLQKASNFNIKKEIWLFNSYSINPFVSFNSEAWNTTKSLFDDRQKIASDLTSVSLNYKSLKDQFIFNDGKWFVNNDIQIQQGEKATNNLSNLLNEF